MRAALSEGRGSRHSARSVSGDEWSRWWPGPAQTGTSLRTSRVRTAIRSLYVVVVQRLQCRCGVGHGRASSAAGHPFARRVRAFQRYGEATRGVNHVGDHAAEAGVRQCSDRARVAPGSSRRPAVGQCADVPVAQPVVDQCEQFSCRGDLGDVLAAAGLDPCAIGRDFRAPGRLLDGLDRRPAHQFAAAHVPHLVRESPRRLQLMDTWGAGARDPSPHLVVSKPQGLSR